MIIDNLNVSNYDLTTKTWSGPKEEILYGPGDNLGKYIIQSLDDSSDKVMQISYETDIQLTGAEIKIRSIRVAQNLIKMGIVQNDVVGIMARNSHNLASVVFGCHFIGAPINTLDPTFEEADVTHMLNLTKPKLMFCDHDLEKLIKRILTKLELDIPIVVFGLPTKFGAIYINEVLAETGIEHNFKFPELGDADKTIAAILCSSGTTGLSKGVSITHGQLLCYANKFGSFRGMGIQDTRLCFSSIYWMSGYSTLLFCTLANITRIITTERSSSDLFFKIVAKYKPSSFLCPPSVAALLINSPEISKQDLSCIKVFMCGGSIVTKDLRTRMEKYLPNGKLCVGYGMTEVVGITTAISHDKFGSVGALIENVTVKIVDDNGNRLGPNEDGEVCMIPAAPFIGYYGNEAATTALFDSEGFICTGDIGHFDEEGFLWIVDRKKDVIKYSNFQITPSEIEEVINKMNGILMASVVGIQHDGSDLPAAVVIKTPNSTITAQDISDVVAQELADYKRLRGGVFFVDELPMTASGKIVKRKVRDIAVRMFQSVKK